MRRIYKWPLPPGTRTLPWSPDDRALMVAEQHGELMIWAEQEYAHPAPQEYAHPAPQRRFVVVGTGFDVPAGLDYIGSAICGQFVWHVYADPIERPF